MYSTVKRLGEGNVAAILQYFFMINEWFNEYNLNMVWN